MQAANGECANHICVFLPSLAGGGAERVMVTLANGFAANGRRTDLVLANKTGPYLDAVSCDVSVIDLQKHGPLAAAPALAKYLQRCRPAVALSALYSANIAALLARSMARAHDTPIVISERNSLVEMLRSKPAWKKAFLSKTIKRLYPAADRIIGISNGVAEELNMFLSLPRNSVSAIHNPLDIDRVVECGRAAPKKNRAAPYIVAVGRLTRQKRFDVLIEAFAKVRQKHDIRLIILGEGEERASLETLIGNLDLQPHVELPGFLSNPFAVMQNARLFALSSDREGFGNVVVEALALGVPIVSTDCHFGPREILCDGEFGRLTPVGSPEALAAAMLETLNEDRAAGVETRYCRAQEFAAPVAIKKYLDVLDGAVAARAVSMRMAS
ncbi:MAG: glycosyltransferase [Pseudomonadota bacterium]